MESNHANFGCYAVVALVSIAIVWTLSQILSLFASAATMNGVGSVIGYVIAWGAVALVMVVVCWGLVLLHRLPRIVQLQQTEFAGKDSELRWILTERYLSAIKDSRKYVASVAYAKESQKLIAERIDRLKIPTGTPGEYEDWLGEFCIFQALQDERAGDVIGKYMGRVAIKTAVSPWKMVDSMAVFYNSVLMIFDIAKIYNRRTSKSGAVRLAARWAFGIYVAREAGQLAESGMDVVTDAAGSLMKPHGISGAIASSLPFVGKIASKAVEGGANALFARALGKRAIMEFRALIPA